MNNKQKLLNIVKNLNLTQSQQNELVNVLSSGLGSGGEDKVFEIKIKTVMDSENTGHDEFMINGVGWFRGLSDDFGYQIDRLNGKPWENEGETIKEMFKDIESYNKLKLTELTTLGDMEISISSTEELTYQLIDTNGIFIIALYSKVRRSASIGHLLMAQITPDGTGTMSIV